MAGIVVSIPLIVLFIYDTPEKHPRISEEECDYIREGLEPDESGHGSVFHALKALAKRPFFWLPTYFTEAKGLAFSDLAYAASIPYIFSIFGIALWSFLGDRTNKRATTAGLGFIGAAVTVFFAASADNIFIVVLLFSVTILINSA